MIFGLNEEQCRRLRANQLEFNKRHMKIVENMEKLMNLPTEEDLAEAKSVGHKEAEDGSC